VSRYERRDYRWLLTADPPVCRAGRPIVVLENCDRLRREESCWCRFDVAEIAEDLDVIGYRKIAEDWLHDHLEPEDVEAFRDEVASAIERAMRVSVTQDDALVKTEVEHGIERVRSLRARLDRLVEREAGMTDRYSDDLEE
jgi:hypothetical protein